MRIAQEGNKKCLNRKDLLEVVVAQLWPKCRGGNLQYYQWYIYSKLQQITSSFCGVIHQHLLLHAKSLKGALTIPIHTFRLYICVQKTIWTCIYIIDKQLYQAICNSVRFSHSDSSKSAELLILRYVLPLLFLFDSL